MRPLLKNLKKKSIFIWHHCWKSWKFWKKKPILMCNPCWKSWKKIISYVRPPLKKLKKKYRFFQHFQQGSDNFFFSTFNIVNWGHIFFFNFFNRGHIIFFSTFFNGNIWYVLYFRGIFDYFLIIFNEKIKKVIKFREQNKGVGLNTVSEGAVEIIMTLEALTYLL